MNVGATKTQSSSNHGNGITTRFYLYPGAIWAEPTAGIVTTVLGSCVAVCLWDPESLLGGVNHFLLPRGGTARSARYANHAMPMLLEKVILSGARRENLVSSMFGGASIMRTTESGLALGTRNINEARDFLTKEGIPLLREDVGGHEGRKLTFRTSDGSTLIRKL